MQTEAELIEQAKAGSVRAFTALVDGYRVRLLRFLLTRCASYADAEDALQDTLINAYRYLYSYNPEWRFSTWLYRIAIRNASHLHSAPGEVVEIGDPVDDGAGPLEQCIDSQVRQNVWVSARRVLNDEVYTAMWLRYIEDMSINDVSVVLKRSTSWTKVNLLRGRRALAAELAEGSGSEEGRAYGKL